MPTTEKHLEGAMIAMHDATPQFIVQPILRQMAEAAITAYLRSVLEDGDVVGAQQWILAYSNPKCDCETCAQARRYAELLIAQAASLSSALERCAGMESDLIVARAALHDATDGISGTLQADKIEALEARLALVEPAAYALLNATTFQKEIANERAALLLAMSNYKPQPQPAQPPNPETKMEMTFEAYCAEIHRLAKIDGLETYCEDEAWRASYTSGVAPDEAWAEEKSNWTE